MATELPIVRNLLTKPVLSFEDRARLAQLLQNLLGDSTITHANIFEKEADRTFMRRFYPHVKYDPSPIGLVKYGHALTSACKGDVITEIMAFCGSKFGKKQSIRSVAIDPKIEIKADTVQMSADSKEIRNLVLQKAIRMIKGSNISKQETEKLKSLLAKHYKKGPVTAENYDLIAFKFLKRYYPGDYAALKSRTHLRPPALSQALSSPLRDSRSASMLGDTSPASLPAGQ